VPPGTSARRPGNHFVAPFPPLNAIKRGLSSETQNPLWLDHRGGSADRPPLMDLDVLFEIRGNVGVIAGEMNVVEFDANDVLDFRPEN
jgi:hypothetical protein